MAASWKPPASCAPGPTRGTWMRSSAWAAGSRSAGTGRARRTGAPSSNSGGRQPLRATGGRSSTSAPATTWEGALGQVLARPGGSTGAQQGTGEAERGGCVRRSPVIMARIPADDVVLRRCRLDDTQAVLALWQQAGATVGVTDSAEDLRRALLE